MSDDNINVFKLLATYLGIDSIRVLIGESTGGAQALEWAIMQPDMIKNLSSWITAFNETKKMAIEGAKDEKQGLIIARAISMMLFRGPFGYNNTQSPERVWSYQRHQGEKFAKRYNSACYLQMLETSLSHDVTRGRGLSISEVLKKIKAKTICIGIDNDLFFSIEDIREMANMIPNGEFTEIHSDYGHDGFLLEYSQITEAFSPLFN